MAENTDQMRALIAQGTIEHLVKEMTPERLTAFADEMLKKIFNELFSGWRYFQEFEGLVKPVFLEQLKDPVLLGRVQKAVQEGLDAAIAGLPDKIAKEVTDAAVQAIKARLGAR